MFPDSRLTLSTYDGLVEASAAVNHSAQPELWEKIGHEYMNNDGRGGKTYLEHVRRELAGYLGIETGAITQIATAVDMMNLAVVTKKFHPLVVTALVTAGAETNAVRTGIDMSTYIEDQEPAGTINVILLTNARLTVGAMARAIVTVTEAKTAALQDLNVFSSYTSNAHATGTGTDSVIVVSGADGPMTTYTGGAQSHWRNDWSSCAQRGYGSSGQAHQIERRTSVRSNKMTSCVTSCAVEQPSVRHRVTIGSRNSGIRIRSTMANQAIVVSVFRTNGASATSNTAEHAARVGCQPAAVAACQIKVVARQCVNWTRSYAEFRFARNARMTLIVRNRYGQMCVGQHYDAVSEPATPSYIDANHERRGVMPSCKRSEALQAGALRSRKYDAHMAGRQRP